MRSWISHGAWNILEHGLSRGLDAAATIALLWCVPTEVFSQLAISQAYVAPMLFLFISPETALYRDFGMWMKEGPSAMLTRIRYFRRFAYFKGAIAVLFSAMVALGTSSLPGSHFSYLDRFAALVWAFSLPLAPQISGPDREFLRLNLDLKALNLVTLLQRGIYLVLLIPAAKIFPESFLLLALCGILMTVFTTYLARVHVEKGFSGVVLPPLNGRDFYRFLKSSLVGFSLGNHISGVIMGWVQTLDLFFLGLFRFPAAEIGLYSIVLKLSNLSLAIPYAVSNFHNVILGRGKAEREGRRLVTISLALTLFCALQAWVFFLMSPWILDLFSRGRWGGDEQARMLGWLRWILPSVAVYASSLFWGGWMGIRRSFKKLIFWVYVPWALFCAVLYVSAISTGGVDAVARANLSAMGLLVLLFAIFSVFTEKSGRPPRSSL